MKGKCWMMDMDLRKGSVLKPDKTGKAIMTILRHLGRIHEVRRTGYTALDLIDCRCACGQRCLEWLCVQARLSLDGKLESVYTLSPESH